MKIAVVGDEGVGKRSLINNLLYYRHYPVKAKIDETHWFKGFALALLEKLINERTLKFQIWVFNPEKHIIPFYYGVSGAIIVFDLTNRQSFDNLRHWVQNIWNHNGKGMIPLVIVGNKVDLCGKSPDSVSSERGEQFASKLSEQTISNGFEIPYEEHSIKGNINSEEYLFFLGLSFLNYIDRNR